MNRLGYFGVVALSFFLLAPAFSQTPSKSAEKSITVYKTPT
jgi:hypothetical protein